MRYDTFVARVRRDSGLHSQAAADRVVQATLRTLGERLAPETRERLAGMLADQLAQPLRTGRRRAASFPAREFTRRVRERSQVDLPPEAAALWVQAVLAALRDALPVREFDELVDQLPADYVRLLAAPAAA